MKKNIINLVIILILGINLQAQEHVLNKELKSESIVVGTLVNGKMTFYTHSKSTEKQILTQNTTARIASISKPITAVAIMQLVEKGKLQLTDSVGQYLQESGALGSVTIENLLTHSSGIAGYKSKKEQENTTQYNGFMEALSIFKHRELAFDPGSNFLYSSYNYTVLGYVVEQVAQTSFADYIMQHIFAPAEMSESFVYSATTGITHPIFHLKSS